MPTARGGCPDFDRQLTTGQTDGHAVAIAAHINAHPQIRNSFHTKSPRIMASAHPLLSSTRRATSKQLIGTIPSDLSDAAMRRGRHFRIERTGKPATDPIAHISPPGAILYFLGGARHHAISTEEPCFPLISAYFRADGAVWPACPIHISDTISEFGPVRC